MKTRSPRSTGLLLLAPTCSAEDGAGWGFFRGLPARGVAGATVITSDAHAGLVAAFGATPPGASWQWCRTHYAANLMAVTPKASWGGSRRWCTRSTTNPTPTPSTRSSIASSTR